MLRLDRLLKLECRLKNFRLRFFLLFLSSLSLSLPLLLSIHIRRRVQCCGISSSFFLYIFGILKWLLLQQTAKKKTIIINVYECVWKKLVCAVLWELNKLLASARRESGIIKLSGLCLGCCECTKIDQRSS